MARWQLDRETCPECGNPREMCEDPESLAKWYPQRSICHATMQREAANRAYDKKHEDRPWHDGTWKRWAAEWSLDFPFHYRDGVTVWVSDQDLTPDDHFI